MKIKMKMNPFRRIDLKIHCASLVCVSVFIVCMGRLAWLAHLPDTDLIKFIPDDAFYYLILAKNFSLEQHWTFDGHAPASGFHLLWAYLLAGAYFVVPNIGWQSLFVASGIVCAVAYSAAAYFVAATVRRLVGDTSAYGVMLVFLGSSAIIQPALMMESSFSILSAAALFFIIFGKKLLVSAREIFLIAFIGILGMLSRSDFGILPLLIFCVTAFAVRDSCRAPLALSAFLGSVIGLGIVVAHTYWISGELAPASAQIKSHWAQVDGMSFRPGYEILLSIALPFFKPAQSEWHTQFSTLLLLAFLGMGLRVSLIHHNKKNITGAYITAVTVLAAYLLLYRHNGALQVWYAGAFLVPISILLGVSFSVMAGRWPALIACIVVAISVYSLNLSMKAPWQWQSSMLKGGINLKEHPVNGLVGSWNAGIISYFSQQPIVNLDGLVNDDILAYAKSGHLSDYIVERKIEYIMDFPFMLSDFFSESHGYGDGKLLACLSPEYKIPAPLPAEQFGGELTLYKVRSNCLGNSSEKHRPQK